MSSSYDSAIIDTSMIHHPDLLQVSSAARFLFVEGIVYSKLHQTDGRIPKHALRLVSVEPDVEAAATELVKAGQWLDEGDAWTIPVFLRTQWSAERVMRKRENDRARMDRFQERHGSAPAERVTKRVSKRVTNGVHNETDPTRPEPKGRGGEGAVAPRPPAAEAASGRSAPWMAETPKAEAVCLWCGKPGERGRPLARRGLAWAHPDDDDNGTCDFDNFNESWRIANCQDCRESVPLHEGACPFCDGELAAV